MIARIKTPGRRLRQVGEIAHRIDKAAGGFAPDPVDMTACASYEACLSLLVPTVRIMPNSSTPQGQITSKSRAEIEPSMDGCVRMRVSQGPLYRANTVKHLSAPHLASFRLFAIDRRGETNRLCDLISSAGRVKKDCDLGVRAMQMRNAMWMS